MTGRRSFALWPADFGLRAGRWNGHVSLREPPMRPRSKEIIRRPNLQQNPPENGWVENVSYSLLRSGIRLAEVRPLRIGIARGHLPHVKGEWGYCFVTSRTIDSLPSANGLCSTSIRGRPRNRENSVHSRPTLHPDGTDLEVHRQDRKLPAPRHRPGECPSDRIGLPPKQQ